MIFDKLLQKRIVEPSQVDNTSGGVAMYMPTVSGEHIDDDTALTFSAWWGCVRGISETIAYLPWNVLKVEGNKKLIDSNHSLFPILKYRPNEEMSSFSFRELGIRQLLGRGNFFAEIEKNRLGNVVSIWPIENDRVNVDRDRKGRLVYDITNGTQGNTALTKKNIFHLKGPGNGLVGLSVVELAKETISLGIAAEKFGGGLFGNGAMPSLVISSDGSTKLGPDGVKNLISTWNKRNKGARNSRKVEYLEKGFKVDQISINPNDAQFLETRKFQVHEVCRWFRYPVHKLAELDRSTNNNIEAENISFVTDTLMPWIARIESETNISLFDRNEIGTHYNKLVVQGLLRGDLKTRAEYYKTMWNMGAFSIDDILDLEDRNPLDNNEGLLRMVPLNMVSVSQANSNGNTVMQKEGVKGSHFRLLQSIAKRYVTIETKRLTAIARKESFKDDAARFYSKHCESFLNALVPAVEVLFSSLKVGGNAEAFTAKFVQDLILNSADEAQKAQESGCLDSILNQWASQKAENIAASLTEKVAQL